ncbi:MAG TPA: trypsin-like peptidase domain-containing protein [Acidimicrobiales bacterium]|nr:trypsin-like peptidase domain-containing protein [Acidimicrobiales bacterium]
MSDITPVSGDASDVPTPVAPEPSPTGFAPPAALDVDQAPASPDPWGAPRAGDDPASAAAAAPQPLSAVPLASATRPRGPRGAWSTRVSLLLVAALVGGLAGHYAAPSNSGPGGVTVNEISSAPGGAVLPSGRTIPALVREVSPSVVSIDVRGSAGSDQGTGMIISSSGLVVTNNHVIANAVGGGTITVTRTGSSTALPATLVGTNSSEDVALIRIENASSLPTVTFGNSTALVAGDAVVAIGNALGLAAGTPTVTQGIVSALGRTVTAGDSTTTETLSNMIQTDAAINPGNSGGPLLDSAGAVIGMNTAVAGTLADGTSAQNIGFAIPSATILSLLKALRAGESVVSHGAFIGVEIMSMTPSLELQFGFSVSSGALIQGVVSGSGAARAGLRQGDIITRINSTSIHSAQDVTGAIAALHPGDVVTVTIVRGTHHLTVRVTLGVKS